MTDVVCIEDRQRVMADSRKPEPLDVKSGTILFVWNFLVLSMGMWIFSRYFDLLP